MDVPNRWEKEVINQRNLKIGKLGNVKMRDGGTE